MHLILSISLLMTWVYFSVLDMVDAQRLGINADLAL